MNQKYFAIFITLFACSNLGAMNIRNVLGKPYFGFETIAMRQKFQSGFGDKVYAQHAQNYNAFFGFKLNHHFGIELGYESQPKKHMNGILLPGDQLPGQQPMEGYAAIKSHYNSTHPYTALFAEKQYSFDITKFAFQVMIGVSSSKVKAHDILVYDEIGLAPTNIANYSKTKATLMLKLATIAHITNHVGIKLSLNYRNMGRITAVSDYPRQTPYVIKMRDAFGVGIGFRYDFCGIKI